MDSIINAQGQWLLNYDPQANSISITWNLLTSLHIPQLDTYIESETLGLRPAICSLTSPHGDCDAEDSQFKMTLTEMHCY